MPAVIAIDAAKLHWEHTLAFHDLDFIVNNNARIPNGHEASVQRGLWYGLQGDFLAATPILLPQLETGLRQVLTAQGVATSGLDQSGVQQEHNLNAFLTEEKYTAILNRLLGEAFIADLQMLLTDKLGANLRNTAAHGLALDAQLEDVPARYSGVLTLRFFLGGMHPAVDS